VNVLVTGGAGYLGSVVSRVLLAAGHRVRVLDSLLHGGVALLGLYAEEGFEFVAGDVREPAAVDGALAGVEAVVHLAAIVGDPACARQPDAARAINLDASLALADRSRAAGVERFVFASTCSNYGRMADPTSTVDEDSELRPVSLYAETKVAVERALLGAEDGGPAVTVLRLATLYGLSPRMRFDLTVNEFTMELATRGELTVFGEQFWRPYLHLRDAARAVAAVLTAPVATVAGRVFNVGDSEQNFRKADLVHMIQEQVGEKTTIHRVHRDEDPRDYRVGFERIRRELDFRISRTVDDGIREVLGAVRGGVFTDLSDPRYRN
jgi:nucleoside-diphosphate-sugar epimerase